MATLLSVKFTIQIGGVLLMKCERFNPYDSAKVEPIVDESARIRSPAYLYTVFDESFRSYQIISDNCGIMLPYIFRDETLIIGTSSCIYYIDTQERKVIKQIEIPSLCMDICTDNDLIIAICETDIIFISEHGKTEYNFDDVINEYTLNNGCLTLSLTDGTRKCIKYIGDK